MTPVEWFSLAEIAAAAGVSKQAVARRARDWPSREVRMNGGIAKQYNIESIASGGYSSALKQLLPAAPTPPSPENPTPDSERSSHLWRWAWTKSQKHRDIGQNKAMCLFKLRDLLDAKIPVREALETVAQEWAIPAATIRGWYYGTSQHPGVREHPKSDWAALMIPGWSVQRERKEIPPAAWDYFLALYLTHDGDTVAECYRRTDEAAKQHGWGDLPALRTFHKRVQSDIKESTRVYWREGEVALARLYPPQKRDRSMYAAGEAVVGDGLKFDKLWVKWPDGEVLNTSTGWFWADLRSNKILAYRLAKTENTDLFRLATYDLTAICTPTDAWIDNTVVAANKAMTGRSGNRHRFKNREDDPLGLLQLVGITPRFTLPDMTKSNPGAKPIERSFGIGGLHDLVAKHPQFLDRGFSKATAIPYAEFAQVVAQEVVRFNARPNRRTDICAGVKSYDEAFAESFKDATVRVLTLEQREMLLLMPEVVTASRERGEIKLQAGKGPHGAHRYWNEAMADRKGQKVVAYYDPADLLAAVTVTTLDGQVIGKVQHYAGVGFGDTEAGREWAKNKARSQKAQKVAAQADKRMGALEAAALTPAPNTPASIPAPGLVAPNFGQPLKRVANGDVVGPSSDPQRQRIFQENVNRMLDRHLAKTAPLKTRSTGANQ